MVALDHVPPVPVIETEDPTAQTGKSPEPALKIAEHSSMVATLALAKNGKIVGLYRNGLQKI